MMTYASDFWPLFWTITGSGALLTVLACLAVATFSPSRHGRGSAPAELATVHRSPAAYGHEAARHPEAA
jgi:hypothetical protein